MFNRRQAGQQQTSAHRGPKPKTGSFGNGERKEEGQSERYENERLPVIHERPFKS